MKKNKSVIQLLLFGDMDGEDDIKLKNIKQTGMFLTLLENFQKI